MLRFIVCCLIAAVIVTTIGGGKATAADRVALVIGNSKYERIGALANGARDATAMKTTLERLGFKVFFGTDLTLRGMHQLVDLFGREAVDASATVVFYAGHGAQLNGENYLVPVTSEMVPDGKGIQDAIKLSTVIRKARPAAGVSVIILDACRDDPTIAAQLQSAAGRPRSGAPALPRASGLATVDADDETFIVFATSPNKTADDGAGLHSPFSTALLKHIDTPDIEITKVLERVTNDVKLSTNGRQTPWYHSSLSTPFGFALKSAAKAAPIDRPQQQAAITADKCEDLYSAALDDADRIRALIDFRERCRTHARYEEAGRKLKTARDNRSCDRALRERTLTTLMDYIDDHPDGFCIREVKAEYERKVAEQRKLDDTQRQQAEEQRRQREFADQSARIRKQELDQKEELLRRQQQAMNEAEQARQRAFTPPPPVYTPPPPATVRFSRFSRRFVEGDGYERQPAASFQACIDRCAGDARCRMVEFYTPRALCNLYAHQVIANGPGDGEVGIRVDAGESPVRAGLPSIRPLRNTYVEGEGYRTFVNTSYETCAATCQQDSRCLMIEFYKPERKCNLFSHTQTSGSNSSADVGLKQ